MFQDMPIQLQRIRAVGALHHFIHKVIVACKVAAAVKQYTTVPVRTATCTCGT